MFDIVKLDWTRRNLPCSLAKASGYGKWSRTFSTEPFERTPQKLKTTDTKQQLQLNKLYKEETKPEINYHKGDANGK